MHCNNGLAIPASLLLFMYITRPEYPRKNTDKLLPQQWSIENKHTTTTNTKTTITYKIIEKSKTTNIYNKHLASLH